MYCRWGFVKISQYFAQQFCGLVHEMSIALSVQACFWGRSSHVSGAWCVLGRSAGLSLFECFARDSGFEGASVGFRILVNDFVRLCVGWVLEI